MAERVLKNALVDGRLTDVTVRDGKIAAIGKTDATGYDCEGLNLRPGLIDIHTHGCGGCDTMDGDLAPLARFHYTHGTTSFLATTMTAPLDTLEALCRVLPDRAEGEASCLGFHLEGPFLSPKAKGAQNERYLALPTSTEGIANVKMVTVAPELPGALEYIRTCGAAVALGHTVADYETALSAFRAGAKCLTHTCNAMPPLHHREPGVIGAAVTSDAYAQVICDGIHIHPAMIQVLWRTFGTSRMILISDSMSATGMPDGTYDLGGQEITVRDGIARTQDGALAGSTSTLYDCVRQAIRFGIPAEDAFRMASATPAALLGLNKGTIAVGYDADFILTDENHALVKAMIL